MKQGDPCPNCGVPVYAQATVTLPGGCLKMLFAAVGSIFTVLRGGVGTIAVGEMPKKPVEASCINCGTRVTVEP